MSTSSRVFPLALVLATLVAGPACATRGYYGNPSGRTSNDRAFRVGFDQGRSRGEDDGRRGRNYDYERYREFRSADGGYGGYGNRNAYRDEFRQGFIRGYDEGYRRYARNDRNGRDDRYRTSDPYGRGPRGVAVSRSPAAQNGYRDGYEAGRDDARDGDRFDPVRTSRYRSGDHDYNSRYGSRDQYKQEYRTAFQQGYDQGYREVRR